MLVCINILDILISDKRLKELSLWFLGMSLLMSLGNVNHEGPCIKMQCGHGVMGLQSVLSGDVFSQWSYAMEKNDEGDFVSNIYITCRTCDQPSPLFNQPMDVEW